MPKQHKDVPIGFPRHATDARITTPLGEVWVAYRKRLADTGRPGLVVTVDGADVRACACPVEIKHHQGNHARLWVREHEEE